MNIVEKLNQVLSEDAASTVLGIKVLEASEFQVVLALTVTQSMTNGYNICHGGVIFSLADTALAFACIGTGDTAVTQSAQIEYLKSAQLGDQLFAKSQIIHRRKRNILCDIQVVNQNDEMVAIVHGKQSVIQPKL